MECLLKSILQRLKGENNLSNKLVKGLEQINKGIETIKQGLETTVYKAAEEIRALGTPCSGDYADCVLVQSSFKETAEIYLFLFAPEGFPRPSLDAEWAQLKSDPARKEEYDQACYDGWVSEITAVEQIVKKYGGEIKIDGDTMPLQTYLDIVKRSELGVPDHRLHVTIQVPGQESLCFVRAVEKSRELFF